MLPAFNRTVSRFAILLIFITSTFKTFSQKLPEKNSFVRIFDGITLKGWESDTIHWRVENGAIAGEVTAATPLKTNNFIIYTGDMPEDFELKAEYRITASGNSGIQYRSEQVPGLLHALKGYQADIDGANVYTGQNYEERGRGFLAMRGQKVTLEPNAKPVVTASIGSSDSLKALIKSNDWNQIRLVVKGNRMQHYINGALMSDATDNDTSLQKFSGLLGFQIHVGTAMKAEFRKIELRKL